MTPPSEPARASAVETRPMQPGQGMVLVHASAGARSFAVFFGKGRYPIADCARACDFWAWPAKYRVQVRQGEGPRDDARLALRVRAPGSYSFVPANGASQNAGLILGVTGPVIGFVGLVFTAAGLFATCSDPPPGQTCAKPTGFYLGLGALAVGGGMTGTGWLLYSHNRAHFEYSASPAAQAGPRVGVLRMPHGGLGLGATLAF